MAIISNDTIFALATHPGRSSLAIVRLSGLKSATVLTQMTGTSVPEPRKTSLRSLRDPVSGEILDRGLVIWFPAPNSFTGEDVAEFHIHGGHAVVREMLSTLANIPRVRLAEPGEFSRRAFLNGKMDLTVAEGLADLIAAETTVQRRQALNQINGSLSKLYDSWREQLIQLLAYLEAVIDFPEEIPCGIEQQVHSDIKVLVEAIRTHLDDSNRGERIRRGIYVAIVGQPNAGKSSLLNSLARREAAIVSTTSGTTRDIIEVHLDLNGYPIILADTAGIHKEISDTIEAEGVRRALTVAKEADYKIVVLDGECWPNVSAEITELIDSSTILVLNKVDKLKVVPSTIDTAFLPRHKTIIPTSALYGTGLPSLEKSLAGQIECQVTVTSRNSVTETLTPVITRLRHRFALQDCLKALERALLVSLPATPELVAEDLRLAIRAIEQISGRVTMEEILDVIFRDFCVGK